jgi:RNA polymerase sigma-70 factor (ECF subfamily)
VVAMLESPPQRAASWNKTAKLVERAQGGDREAFGLLVEQFQRTVYAICLGRLGHASEAAELTQEVFLHVMNRLDQLREPERFAGWLRQVAARMAINRATRRVPPSPIQDEVLEGLGASHDNPLETLIRHERAARLWEGLARLKPLDRETLVAFYIHGHSLVEMAERHDAPIGTIKRRLHTARLRLKAELQAASADEDEWTEAEPVMDDEPELVGAL